MMNLIDNFLKKNSLSRYADGVLSTEESLTMEEHLRQHSSAQMIVDDLRSVGETLKFVFSTWDDKESVAQRLDQHISDLVQNPDRSTQQKWFPFRGGLPLPMIPRRAVLAVTLVILAIAMVPTLLIPNLDFSNQASSTLLLSQIEILPQLQEEKNRFENIGNSSTRLGIGLQEKSARRSFQVGEALQSLGYAASPQQEKYGMGMMGGMGTTTSSEGVPTIASNDDDGDGIPDDNGILVSTPDNVLDDRKIVRTAQMAIEVESVSEAQASVKTFVRKSGGMIARTTLTDNRAGPRVLYTLWVPAEKLEQVVGQLEALGKVHMLESRIQDITEQYFDRQTRIDNLKVQEKRLLRLYEREVEKLDELLKVEREITRTRTEIERLEGTQRLANRQVQYSTIDLEITQTPEEKPIVESEPQDMFTPLRRAAQDTFAVLFYSVSLVTTILAWSFSLLVFLIPWAVIVGLISLLVGLRKKD